MKIKPFILGALFTVAIVISVKAQDISAPRPKGAPPGGKKGGPGSASQESAEMQALLKSFNLTAEQQAKYDAARAETSKQMRAISAGKADGTLSQPEVLKQALASHRAFNSAVKAILSPDQYAKWEPLRESDHHKIAQSHKERDEQREAEKNSQAAPKPEPQK